jgi:4-amino-4-deoxy-L-arabinose transferase-like glycosyltransferase
VIARARSLAASRWLAPVALIALAAVVRLPGLEGRGPFDADQGNDMMTLWRFVTTGEVPLVGPKASVGDFHQGVLYWLLLLPSAALFGAEPLVVMFQLALIGIAGVLAIWWVATTMGGRVAGASAGLLAAVSPAEIGKSTAMWCVDPITLFAALAVGCAWRGWVSTRAVWWVGAFAATAAVAQLHLVGPVLAVPIVSLYVLKLRRAGHVDLRRRVLRAGLVGGAAAAALFVPLAMSELQTGFAEARNIAAYLASDSDGSALGGLQVVLVALMRALSYPFAGQITDVPAAAAASAAVVATLGVTAAIRFRSSVGAPAAFLVATVAWGVGALAFAVPTVATVVPGLPNDQYHFFLHPVVLILAGLGMAALWSRTRIPARAVAVVALLALVVISIARTPAAVDANGGWPRTEAAGSRVVSVAAGLPIALIGAPHFKAQDAMRFAVVYSGGTVAAGDAPVLVVTCDRLFATVISASCGGAAEDQIALDAGVPTDRLVDRFDVSPRIAVSIYSR